MKAFMNFVKFKLYFLLFLLFFSCAKNDHDDIKADGSGTAMINGLYWEAKARVTDKGEKFHVHFERFEKFGDEWYPVEDASVFMMSKQADIVQRIHATDITVGRPDIATKAMGSFNASSHDWDVGCDSYEVYEEDSVNNWVRIDREQGNFKKIWGSFSMHLYRSRTCSESPRPEADTLKITNGTFVVEL